MFFFRHLLIIEGLPFRLWSEVVILFKHRYPFLVDAESEGRELAVPDKRGADLADVLVFLAYLDLQDGLSLVVEFCADVAAQIVITLVQMKDGMYVDIVLAAPSHQQANHFCSLS